MKKLTTRDQTTEFLLYTAPNGAIKVELLLSSETIWLTQKRTAELFGLGVAAISKRCDQDFWEHRFALSGDSGRLQNGPTTTINLDYILEFIFEKNKNVKDKASLIEEVRRVIRASLGNRAKESLVD